MSRLLPFKSEAVSTPDDPRVLDLEDEATEAALSALSSETARSILSAVYEEPMTPPEIRDEVGTSLQNVHYHVENLEEADLIEPAGTGYSEKGTEMTVYGPASKAVVFFAGQEHDRSRLKTALSRFLGGVSVLALASFAVQRFVETAGPGVPETTDGLEASGGDGGGGPVGGANATDAPVATGTETGPSVMDTVDGGQSGRGTHTSIPAQETPSVTGGTPEPTSTPSPAGTPTEAASTPAASPTPAPSPTETATGVTAPDPTGTPLPDGGTVEGARRAAEGGADGLLADPGVAFFLGGLFMLVVLASWWYLQG